MADDAVLVVDGGDFVATASYIVRPRAPLSWLDPGVFGTLGVGGGFALGAALVRPGREVWLVWGDGSSAYTLAEFDTLRPPRRRADRGDRQRRVVDADRARAGRDARHVARHRSAAHRLSQGRRGLRRRRPRADRSGARRRDARRGQGDREDAAARSASTSTCARPTSARARSRCDLTESNLTSIFKFGMAALVLAASPAHAERRLFTEGYEFGTTPEDKTTVELWHTQTRDSWDDTSPQRFEQVVRFAHGLTDRWELAIDTTFAQVDAPDPMVAREFGLDSLRFDTSYRLADRNDWPVDVAAYLEGGKDFGGSSYLVEGRVLASRDFDRFVVVANAVADVGFGHTVENDIHIRLDARRELRSTSEAQPRRRDLGNTSRWRHRHVGRSRRLARAEPELLARGHGWLRAQRCSATLHVSRDPGDRALTRTVLLLALVACATPPPQVDGARCRACERRARRSPAGPHAVDGEVRRLPLGADARPVFRSGIPVGCRPGQGADGGNIIDGERGGVGHGAVGVFDGDAGHAGRLHVGPPEY